MVCKNCEKEVMDDAYFCPYCGAKLKEYELEVPLEEATEEQTEKVEQVAAEATGDKQETAKTEEKPTNDMALIGFVGSFVSPLLGFALGGIGLARSFKRKGAGKGFSIAALCVAAAGFLLNVTLEACSLMLLY
ncbi:MAG: zinc ribbon domain-containing protein [Clostridia bacterium]|nr:zinc ribbon domain-containing protein [Clostridia bacterium]